MRCSFCRRRIRAGEFSEIQLPSGKKIFHHYAPEGSSDLRRHCSAAALHKGDKLGIRPTLWTTDYAQAGTPDRGEVGS